MSIDLETTRNSHSWSDLQPFVSGFLQARCDDAATTDQIKHIILVGKSGDGFNHRREFVRSFDKHSYITCLRDKGYIFERNIGKAGKHTAAAVSGKHITFLNSNRVAISNREKWLPIKRDEATSSCTNTYRLLMRCTGLGRTTRFPMSDIAALSFHGNFGDAISAEVAIKAPSEFAASRLFRDIDDAVRYGRTPFPDVSDEFTYQWNKRDTIILKLDTFTETLVKMTPGP